MHRLYAIRPSIPQGVLGGHTFKSLGISLGIDIAKYNSPLKGAFWGVLHKFKSLGHFWGFGGSQGNLSLGKLPNGWTDWHQIRYTSVDSSGNGHRLNTIRPRYPTAALGGGGGFRGSTIQKPGKCGQTAGPIGIKFSTYNAGESGNRHRLNKLAS